MKIMAFLMFFSMAFCHEFFGDNAGGNNFMQELVLEFIVANFPMIQFLKARYSEQARQLKKLKQYEIAHKIRQNAM